MTLAAVTVPRGGIGVYATAFYSKNPAPHREPPTRPTWALCGERCVPACGGYTVKVKSKWRKKSPTLRSCAGSRQTCQMASCVMAKWYQVPGMICGARVVFGQTQLPSHSGRLGDSNGVCLGVQVDCLVTAASQARRTRHQRLSMLKLEQDQRKVSPLNASQ